MSGARRAYVVGATIVALIVVAVLALFDLGGPPVLQLLLPAVVAAAYLGGLWPGIATTVLATISGIVLMPPVGSISIAHHNDLVRVFAFTLVGILISVLTEALHRARTKAEANHDRLLRSDQRFMRAFYASPIAQAVSRLDRKVLEVNDAYLATFGVTRERIIDHSAADAGILVDAAPELIAQLRHERELRAVELTVHTPNGKTLSMLMSSHMVDLHGEEVALSSFVDLTARVVAEAEARAASDRFAQLAEAIREVFWLTDPLKGAMLYISPAYEQIWGRSCEGLYAAPATWLEAIHPDDRDRVIAALAKQNSGEYDEQYRIVQPNGNIRWIRDKAFPIRDDNGQVFRLAGVATDITEQRVLEDQVRQAQKLDSVGQLAGGIAHDFNNLLNVIVANTDLIREDATVPLHREMLDEIDAAVSRASALTRQLLAFSRKQPSEAIVLDINRVVEDTRRMLRRLVGDDILIRVSFEPEVGRLRCDPSQLVQVLMNLAVNARDAMNGGGTLRIETRQEANHVLLVVADDGCGMPPEVLARVFEPFFTTKEVGKGTGLGLAVVHGIVEQAGGSLSVESTVDVGTTFTLRFPRVADQIEPIANVLAVASRGTERILLVDDDWHVRSAAARALRSRGYTVLEAEDGRAALRILDERTVDLLVTDVVMPGMDGRRLFEAAHRRMPQLPVLFMSGYTDDEVVHRGVQAAELAFLEKPFRVHALAAKVRQVLDDTHA